jgi:hypothetical protein
MRVVALIGTWHASEGIPGLEQNLPRAPALLPPTHLLLAPADTLRTG